MGQPPVSGSLGPAQLIERVEKGAATSQLLSKACPADIGSEVKKDQPVSSSACPNHGMYQLN